MIPQLARHLFWPLTERLCQRDTMARLGRLSQTDHASAEQLREAQVRKLRRILQVASEHCPFYAQRIRNAGLDPNDPDVTLDDLPRLPTLTRDDVRDHARDMIWPGYPGGPIDYNTGGSTGEPLKFCFDRARQAADAATRWRARGWWNVYPGDREILLWGAPTELAVHHRTRRWRDRLLNQRMLNAFDMSPATMNDYLEHIRRARPVCLYGYAGSFALLARHFRQRDGTSTASFRGLQAVFVTGEVLLEPDREIIESAFGVPVVNEYGARDAGLIASECPAGELHVAEEYLIVELLDPQSSSPTPVTPGEIGEVVVTHLENHAMPFIRYRTGDLARWASRSGERCACGRAHAGLAEVRGRATDQIVCRDGHGFRKTHALSLIYVLREADGVRQFRITQLDVDRLDVEIVVDEDFSFEIQDRIARGLHRCLGNDGAIKFYRRDRIPPTASGKHACVISHVDLDVESPDATNDVAYCECSHL